MSNLRRLFLSKNPYKINNRETAFCEAMRENYAAQCALFPNYFALADLEDPQIKTLDDLNKLPALTTLFLKRNPNFAKNSETKGLKVTSSGTGGVRSDLVFDSSSVRLGLGMALRFFAYHKLVSPMPTQYIIMGYEPTKNNQAGAVKTAFGASFFAPPLERVYALKHTPEGYAVNIDGISAALLRYAKRPFPVRIIGFPSFLWQMVTELKSRGICLNLPNTSKILLGGGWKQFSDQRVSDTQFFETIEETLGIKRHQIYEFFSAVEHPIPYLKCQQGHFHTPVYSRVVARDPETLAVVPPGELGILNFMTPLVQSAPLLSVMTDDLGICQEGGCGCGLDSPFFKWVGRAGIEQIKTCAMEANQMAGGERE